MGLWKNLALVMMRNHDHIFKSKHICIAMKIRNFMMYIASVFLYNSEIWAVNKTLSDKIDSFHRRLLRYAINYKWPKKLTNVDLWKNKMRTMEQNDQKTKVEFHRTCHEIE